VCSPYVSSSWMSVTQIRQGDKTLLRPRPPLVEARAVRGKPWRERSLSGQHPLADALILSEGLFTLRPAARSHLCRCARSREIRNFEESCSQATKLCLGSPTTSRNQGVMETSITLARNNLQSVRRFGASLRRAETSPNISPSTEGIVLRSITFEHVDTCLTCLRSSAASR